VTGRLSSIRRNARAVLRGIAAAGLGGRVPPVVRAAVSVLALAYGAQVALLLAGNDWCAATLGLHAREALAGAVWQPFTHVLVYPVGDPAGALFDLLALWLFGAPVASRCGTRLSLSRGGLILAAGALATIAVALVAPSMRASLHLLGPTALCWGLVAAWGVQNADVPMRLLFMERPFSGRVFALSILGVWVLAAAVGGSPPLPARLGGVLTGFFAAGGRLRFDLLRAWWVRLRARLDTARRRRRIRPVPRDELPL
jgi:hypothetical protein